MRQDPRGLVAPSRWWLLIAVPVVAVLSAVVALVAAALEPPRPPPEFVRTQRSTAVADAYVEARRPGSNFGRTSALRTDTTARSYLRFLLPQVSGTVMRARLRVWAEHGDASGYGVRVVRSRSWTEPTITAGSRPRLGPLVATSRRFTGPGWVTVDVTRLIPDAGRVDLALVPRGRHAAVYDSREGRHPPELVLSSSLASVDSPSSSASLVGIVTDVIGARRYRFQLHDNRRHSMDALRIIQVGDRQYLGVYHSEALGVPSVHVATSHDLLHWEWQATLDHHASQPTIEALPGGSFLVREETDTNGLTYPPQTGVRVRHYADERALLSAQPNRTASALSGTQTNTFYGTQGEYTGVRPSGSALSRVDGAFLESRLSGDGRTAESQSCYPRWSARREHALADAVLAAGATGQIGHRDILDYRGDRFVLVEAQVRPEGAWRVFLYDPQLDVAHPLDIRTPRRSRDFAGPSATVVTAPSGAPAVVVTLYLPSSGAAVGESGELVYYRDLDRATSASSLRGGHASGARTDAC